MALSQRLVRSTDGTAGLNASAGGMSMVNTEDGRTGRRAAGRLAVRLTQASIPALGAFLAIYALASLSLSLHTMLLVAPFGGSCALIFSMPHSVFARPRNVIGGHLLAALVGLVLFHTIGASPFSYALGVGLAMVVMQVAGLAHPPAAANPMVMMMLGADWDLLATPMLAGAVAIVVIATLYHQFVSRQAYPGGRHFRLGKPRVAEETTGS